jgi:hypothetical protein
MSETDGSRRFVLREEGGNETSVFTGRAPRQAALKAARRLYPAPSPDEVDDREVIRLRERGTDRVHVYEGWAWRESADDDTPDWLGDEVVRANVSKQGVEYVTD